MGSQRLATDRPSRGAKPKEHSIVHAEAGLVTLVGVPIEIGSTNENGLHARGRCFGHLGSYPSESQDRKTQNETSCVRVDARVLLQRQHVLAIVFLHDGVPYTHS